MVRAAIEALGGIDYLVNNAATPGKRSAIPTSDLESRNEAFWTKLLSVNLVGPFRCVRAAAAALKASKGAVVNVAATAAFGGGASSTTYATTKAGLVLMTRELAKGLGPDVRVNAVAPGWVVGSDWECKLDESEAKEAAIRDITLLLEKHQLQHRIAAHDPLGQFAESNNKVEKGGFFGCVVVDID
jgi:3-oxoacyl-[acyl-carrier protein] reductase